MASITIHKSNGEKAGEFPKILWEMLQYLGHQKRPLYKGSKEKLIDRVEWDVQVFIYTPKPNKEGVFKVALTIGASGRRSTFYAGIRGAACQAMYRVRENCAHQLSNTRYRYFPLRRVCNTQKKICYNKHQIPELILRQIRLTMALVAVCDDTTEELIETQGKVRELEEELEALRSHKAIVFDEGEGVSFGGSSAITQAQGDPPSTQKSAEGRTGCCIAHGGGRRCQYAGCGKGSEGSTNFCIGHGGGKRCTHRDCSKGAEGSTPFCKAHGGGKRCAVDGCRRSARGRTDSCVGHGGGKRCHFAGCGKSAQGSTDFCKSHGGSGRYSWGHSGSELGSGGAPCDRLARGKRGLCDRHNPLVDDNRVHGGVSFGGFLHTVEAPRHVAASAREGRVHGGNSMPIMLDGGVGLGVNNADASTSASRYWKNMEKPFGSAQRSLL